MVPTGWSSTYTARATKEFLRKHFPRLLISLYKDVEWPPYSSDLNSSDFFLWGYLKDQIYKNPKPRDLGQLKANIQREILNISKRDKQYSSMD